VKTAILSVLVIECSSDEEIRYLHGYGPEYDVDTLHEYRDVTPLSWGARFHSKIFVSAPAMRLIAARGGHE
jgi:hypothetical protein